MSSTGMSTPVAINAAAVYPISAIQRGKMVRLRASTTSTVNVAVRA